MDVRAWTMAVDRTWSLSERSRLILRTLWSYDESSHYIQSTNANDWFWVDGFCAQENTASAVAGGWGESGPTDLPELPSGVHAQRTNPVRIFRTRGGGGARQSLMNSPGPLLNVQTRLHHCWQQVGLLFSFYHYRPTTEVPPATNYSF